MTAISDLKRVDTFLDKVASLWADHFECQSMVREMMEVFPDVDWIDALKRSIPRQEKKHPDSTRMRTLFHSLAGELLGVDHKS